MCRISDDETAQQRAATPSLPSVVPTGETVCKCGLDKDDPIHSYTTKWQQMHTFDPRAEELPCACRTFVLDRTARAYLDGCDFVHTVAGCPEYKLTATTQSSEVARAALVQVATVLPVGNAYSVAIGTAKSGVGIRMYDKLADAKAMCEAINTNVANALGSAVVPHARLVEMFLQEVYSGTAHAHRQSVLMEFASWVDSRSAAVPEENAPAFRTTKEAMEWAQRNSIPAVIPVTEDNK